MSINPVIGKKDRKFLSARFHDFLSAHPPLQVSRHLRCVLLDYLSGQLDLGYPADFDNYLWEFYDLFELLDEAAVFYPTKKTVTE